MALIVELEASFDNTCIVKEREEGMGEKLRQNGQI
jgi:hypothetical protein